MKLGMGDEVWTKKGNFPFQIFAVNSVIYSNLPYFILLMYDAHTFFAPQIVKNNNKKFGD